MYRDDDWVDAGFLKTSPPLTVERLRRFFSGEPSVASRSRLGVVADAPFAAASVFDGEAAVEPPANHLKTLLRPPNKRLDSESERVMPFRDASEVVEA